MNFDTTLEIARFSLGFLLVLANIAVWYGVWLERESAPPQVQQKGWRILVRGLAAETTIGFLLFAADTSIGVRQTAQIASATQDAANLVNSFGGLHQFVTDQEKKNAGALNDLRKQTGELNQARIDAQKAAGAARGDLTKVSTLLDQEREVHDKILTLAAPRILTPAQSAQLAKDVKPFAGTHFDMGSGQAIEAVDLVAQIGDLLKANGWIWDANTSVTVQLNIPGRPSEAFITRSGVAIIISQSQMDKFGRAVEAIVGDLRAAKIATDGLAVPDQLNGQPNPERVQPGAIHIQIGDKPPTPLAARGAQ